jgi:hypothetical protein
MDTLASSVSDIAGSSQGRHSQNNRQDFISGFHCLCQQLAYLVLVRIFLIASEIGK